MATEEYCVGYDEGYQAGWNAALEPAPPSKQEPVAWEKSYDIVCALLRQAHDILATTQYPIKRPWVGLHWDNLPEIYAGDRSFLEGAKWAEAKLKEKNT